jgi:hypothetical protein
MMNRIVRIISNIVYSIGVLMTVSLGCIALFGTNQVINQDVMLPLTWKEQAFIWLAFGTIPMLLACLAVYKFNVIKDSLHKKRNFFLIFLPGFICTACALFIIGLLIAGMVNSFLL